MGFYLFFGGFFGWVFDCQPCLLLLLRLRLLAAAVPVLLAEGIHALLLVEGGQIHEILLLLHGVLHHGAEARHHAVDLAEQTGQAQAHNPLLLGTADQATEQRLLLRLERRRLLLRLERRRLLLLERSLLLLRLERRRLLLERSLLLLERRLLLRLERSLGRTEGGGSDEAGGGGIEAEAAAGLTGGDVVLLLEALLAA